MTETRPPMFPSTASLVEWQAGADEPAVDGAAWLRDVRQADEVLDDDPFNSCG
jgi:hypothetical protein